MKKRFVAVKNVWKMRLMDMAAFLMFYMCSPGMSKDDCERAMDLFQKIV